MQRRQSGGEKSELLAAERDCPPSASLHSTIHPSSSSFYTSILCFYYFITLLLCTVLKNILHNCNMSSPSLHNALLRPPIIQVLRAAGYHATRPSVLDTLTDLVANYIMILASSATSHAANSHPGDPVPALEDIYQALQDVGALRPHLRDWEEDWQGEEDTRGLDAFLSWFSGPMNREIRRIAGLVPSEGDMLDPESLEKEDFLTALKKKHSKTGEESRYAGTVLGKSAEEHPVVIEGGVPSIQEWGMQVRSRTPRYQAESESSGMSSAPSNLSDVEGMDV